MKIVNKLILQIFSFFILIVSVIGIMTLLGITDVSQEYLTICGIINDPTSKRIGIIILSIFILLALKGLFFYERKDDFDDGIQLENDDGRLIITRHTLKNIIDQTVKSFENIEDNYTKITIDENSDISILETIYVTDDTIIKDLSNNIQIKVKEAVKKSLDIELKGIDIRVRDVVKKKTSKAERK